MDPLALKVDIDTILIPRELLRLIRKSPPRPKDNELEQLSSMDSANMDAILRFKTL